MKPVMKRNAEKLCYFWFIHRSKMTSKCGKNKKVAYEAQPSVSLMFVLTTF